MDTPDEPITPGPNDPMAQLTTPGINKDNTSGPSLDKSPGHQGEQNTGGKNIGLRVLFCSNIPFIMDYEQIYLLMKPFGSIKRIRLTLDRTESSYDCYVVFDDHISASKAKEHFHNHSINDKILKTRIFHIDNFKEELHDFFPVNTTVTETIERKLLPPKWFVASYKIDKENLIKGAEYIRKKVGNIPDDNIKRYGRSLLIKAGNASQSCLLCHFKTSDESNIDKISPHKSFNYAKGVVYSKELFEFSEGDILKRCPDNVCDVKKLKGTNHGF